MEVYELHEKEFKIIIIKMLNKLREMKMRISKKETKHRAKQKFWS